MEKYVVDIADDALADMDIFKKIKELIDFE